MAKKSLSGQMNMFDFFSEEIVDEDGALKDAEMISFSPADLVAASVEEKESEAVDTEEAERVQEAPLEVIDFDLDESLPNRHEKQKEDVNQMLLKADQVIREASTKARRTDEEIWIEEQIAKRSKRKSRTKEIHEQVEFAQTSLFLDETGEEKPLGETQPEKKTETKAEAAVKKKSTKQSIKPKEAKEDKETVGEAQLANDSNIVSKPITGAVMSRSFQNADGRSLNIAYLSYNKVYVEQPGEFPVTYVFKDTYSAVNFYVKKMHECQDNRTLKERELSFEIQDSRLIDME